jgi:hypothetical protein
LDVTKATLVAKMETMWRACMRVGGHRPTHLLAGSLFIDTYQAVADTTINRQMTVSGKTGPMDIAINEINYKGVPIIWDPVMDQLQTDLSPVQEWTSRCYFLNRNYLKLRPAQGQDMVSRNPPRAFDRYTHYWAMTWRGGVTTNNPGSMGLLTVTGS